MDFNKDRFLAFGQYDLTINKAFYRTMTLITVFVTTGLTFVAFLVRWLMHSSMFGDTTLASGEYVPYQHYSIISGTVILLLAFLSTMHTIFAGFSFHNLRNKQGRISELMAPATNFEKFTWHLLVSLGGGLLVIIVAILFADGFNAILNLICHPMDAQSSITCGIFNLLFTEKIANVNDQEVITGFSASVRFFAFCVSLSGTMFFVLGNAIKYKYNIILTYLVYQFTMIMIFVGIVVTGIHLKKSGFVMNPQNAELALSATIHTVTIINIGLAILWTWLSYRLYKKAQISSSRNK